MWSRNKVSPWARAQVSAARRVLGAYALGDPSLFLSPYPNVFRQDMHHLGASAFLFIKVRIRASISMISFKRELDDIADINTRHTVDAQQMFVTNNWAV